MRPDTEYPPASDERRPSADRTGAAMPNIATLLPTLVPDRLTRKARHCLPQILQRRAQGYTLEAIQQALAAVAVLVSVSTVRRQAMRARHLLLPRIPGVEYIAVETFSTLAQHGGSHEDFDCFIVPTVPDPKQQQDTITTLVDLARLGLLPERLIGPTKKPASRGAQPIGSSENRSPRPRIRPLDNSRSRHHMPWTRARRRVPFAPH